MKRTRILKKERQFYDSAALQKLMGIIFEYPESEFSLSELAASANVSKSTAHRLLKVLLDYAIIKIEEKVVFRIKANMGNAEYIKRKVVHNLYKVYESNIVEFLDNTLGHPPAIILFGSFRKGDDISSSDIDLAVETMEEVETQTLEITGLEEFEKLLGRKVQVLLFNRKKVNINVFNNIANGILLAGFLEVKP